MPKAFESRLVVPERFVIDEVTRERLLRELEHAPPGIAGIVAESRELPPGASYRVEAEWRSLEPASALVAARSASARGAVMLREGVAHETAGDVVTVPEGTLLVDPGAFVHDPWPGISSLSPASEKGRPPFTRRPVVVLLGLDRDDAREDWARRLVNRLVRRDIEGRLATPTGAARGFHLTQPCTPSAESIRALVPDVIITLDDAAARVAPEWCTDRSTVIVHYSPDEVETAELVSWQIGRAEGRVRARIGRRVDAPGVAELVHRLSAGPQPAPPVDELETRPRSSTKGGDRARRAPAPRALMMVASGVDPDATARARGLVDNLAAIGVNVEVGSLEGDIDAARAAPLLVLVDVAAGDRVDALIEARRAAGGVTVIDVGPSDLRADTGPAAPPALTDRARDLVRACGLVTAPAGAVARAVDALPVRALPMPTLISRARAATLARARTLYDATEPTIGWHIGPRGIVIPLDAPAEAIAGLLAARSDLRVTIVGEPEAVPGALAGHARVSVCGVPELEAEAVSAWTVHLWNPGFVGGLIADDLRAVTEAAIGAVPTVLPDHTRPLVEGYTPEPLVVEDPARAADWEGALRYMIDDPTSRTFLAHHTARYARSVYGPVASKIAANRFYGWATFKGTT